MRILIVGLGAAGQRHARNLRAILGDDVELVALRRKGGDPALSNDLTPDRGVQPEQRLRIRALEDLGEALSERPDGAIVSNPSSMHIETCIDVLRARVPLLVEKPLSNDWDGVPAFLKAAADSRVPVIVGYQFRFHPLLERVADLLRSGTFGEAVSASSTYGEYLPGWHPYEDYRTSYAARKELGGGVLLTQIHDIDYLGWLLGWPDEVYSVGGHLSHLEVDVDDTALCLWPSVLHGRRVPVQLSQDYLRRPPVRRMDMVFERGTFTLDLLGCQLRGWNADGDCVIDERPAGFERNDLFLAETRHFLACIEGREAPRVPPQEAVKSLAVALAALRSQASGTVEHVSYT